MIQFDEQEDEYWTCTQYSLNSDSPVFRLTLQNMEDDDEPSETYQNKVIEQIQDVQQLILQSCKHIVENYSYEHYKRLGVPEERLVREETADAIRPYAKLIEIVFYDEECDSFEMSFHVAWDEYHSYDVEFEDGQAVCCSVNG